MPLSTVKRILEPLTTRLADVNLHLSSRQWGELFWLGAGQLVTMLLSIVTVKIITSIGPEEYGVFILVTSITGLFAMAFFGPLEQAYVRFYFDYDRPPERRRLFLVSLKKLLGRAFLILCLLLLIVIVTGHIWFGLEIDFLLPAGGMIMLTVLALPLSGMMNAMRLRKQVSLALVGEKMLMLLLLAAVFVVGVLNISTVMACIMVSAGILLLVRLRVYDGATAEEPVMQIPDAGEERALRKEITRNAVTYGIPFVGWGMLSWLQMNGERWVINGLLTSADVGRYGLAASLIQSTVVVAFNVISQFVTPGIYRHFSEGSRSGMSRAMVLVRLHGLSAFLVFLIAGAILWIAGGDIIRLISTREFSVDGLFLFVLCFGLGMFYVGQALTAVGLGLRRPGVYLVPKIAASVLAIFSYYVGCLLWEAMGVAVALFVTNTVYFFLILWTNHRLLSSPVPSPLEPKR